MFWDGSNEWPEMSSEDRYSFLVPITVAGYLGALLLIGGLLAYVHWYFKKLSNSDDTATALRLVLLLVLPLFAWFAFRFAQVLRSIHRYNDRGKIKPS
jgi:hypothetical protein